MTGDEHYREAERLLKHVSEESTVLSKKDPMLPEQMSAEMAALGLAVAKAQAHATLALGAATAGATWHPVHGYGQDGAASARRA